LEQGTLSHGETRIILPASARIEIAHPAQERLWFHIALENRTLRPHIEYLARGGRIGGAAALLGSVLRVKPILTLRDGRADQLEKTRTHRRALARLKELVLEQIPRDGSGYLSVMHAAVPDQAERLAGDLGGALNLPSVPIMDVPPAIVTHAGPGVLAVAFFVAE
jgi:DegV family protein with EDD domain